MRRDRKIGSKAYIRSFLVRRTWRVILSFAGLVVATASVLVACSAPQSQTSQPNNQQQGAPADWKPVEQAMGKAGTVQPDGVYKIGLPRTDLHVKVGDVEVNSVIATLRANGIAVTALHSHMLEDSPHLFFMHFWANDDALKLARGLRAALDKTNSAK